MPKRVLSDRDPMTASWGALAALIGVMLVGCACCYRLSQIYSLYRVSSVPTVGTLLVRNGC